MKKAFFCAAFALLAASPWFLTSCVRGNLITPSAATPTPIPPQTYTITIASGSLGTYSGYYYSCASGSNNSTTGLFSLTAHVGDSIALPAASIHPLYFLDNTGTCVDNGLTSPPSNYTFSATGTYYFHCGFHATSCSPNNTTCNATGCAGLAGTIIVQ